MYQNHKPGSVWITHPMFVGLPPLNLFHKERTPLEIPPVPPTTKNAHILFHKVFSFPDKPSDCTLSITADDYYKLWINGVFVGQGPAPAYPHNYRYNRYDIAPYLRPGVNVFAVHVYYQGLRNRVWNSGDNRMGLCATVYRDGQKLFGTDETWLCRRAEEYLPGGVVGYETGFLENIDMRYACRGWRGVLTDTEGWENAVPNFEDDHVLREPPAQPVMVFQTKPVSVEKISPQEYFVDFGREIAGQFAFCAKGTRGDTVKILCGEETEPENPKAARHAMRCGCDYEECVTLSGEVDEIFFYDYKAFRYVTVRASGDFLRPATFFAWERHAAFDESRCQFTASDKTLEGVFRICANGVRVSTQEGFLDCPTREKGQYLGDFSVSGLSYLYLTGNAELVKKALHDFADTLFISPGMMAVAPGSLMQEIADFSLQYPMQLYHYYEYTGDRETLRELYPAVLSILLYFAGYEREDGLLEGVTEKWNLVDWPDNLRDGYDFPLTNPIGVHGVHNVLNGFYIGAHTYAERIAAELGLPVSRRTEQLIAAYNRAFYRSDTGLYADSEKSNHTSLHANVLPLLYDMAPQEATAPILSLIRQKGLCCGVQFAYFVLKALSHVEEYGLEYELLTATGEHSWGNMLREGATACFEAWGKDQKWNTSLCHPWASAPIIAIVEDIVGINPSTFATGEYEIEPHIPQGVSIDLTLPFGNLILRFCSDGLPENDK